MHLAIQFDYLEYSEKSLEELGLPKDRHESSGRSILVETLTLGDAKSLDPDRQTLSVFAWTIDLLNRCLSRRADSRVYADESREKYVEFIIEMDKNGDELEHTCDPDILDSNESKPGATGYLTRVDFQKQVLDEYYRNSRYEVSSGTLSCGGLWSHLYRRSTRRQDMCLAWRPWSLALRGTVTLASP